MRMLFIAIFFIVSAIPVAGAEELLLHHKLLQQQQFDQLEESLKYYNDGYLDGDISLRDYYWSNETIWRQENLKKHDWFKQALQQWLTKEPDSAYANVLNGRYYLDKAFIARGTKWSSQTSEQQFKEMERLLDQALPYLEKGLKIDPDIISGHAVMFNIIKARQHSFAGNSLNDKLLQYMVNVPVKIKQKPAIWIRLLNNSTPRWDGTYKEMMEVIENRVPDYIADLSKADRLMLRDVITEDKISYMLLGSDDFSEPEKKTKYTRALNLAKNSIDHNTGHAGVYELAARSAYNLQDYKQCYQYARKAASLRPWRPYYWHYLGSCSFKLQKFEKMNEAYQHRIYLGKLNKYDIFQLGLSYMYLYQFDKAYLMFKTSEELDQQYKKYTKQYTSYIEKEKPESMGLVGQDIGDVIGALQYQPENHYID